MAHRKEEYEAAGHEVTIQQVNEGGDISAWIDGKAAYADAALESVPIDTEGVEMWDKIKRLMAFMADTDVYFCKKCNTFYDCTDSSGTGFAGHQCGDCARGAAHCADNPDGDSHEDECLNPRQKRNARVATKYRCVHCGRKRQTTPTG